jgi:hypothetical protein
MNDSQRYVRVQTTSETNYQRLEYDECMGMLTVAMKRSCVGLGPFHGLCDRRA